MRKPTLRLVGLATATAAIYFVAFVWRYSLLQWWPHPEETIAKISGHAPVAGAAYVAAMAALFLLYLAAAWTARTSSGRAAWGAVIAGIVAFNAILLFLYPVDAADIFDNIIRGRLTAFYGANPFYQTPIHFPQDPFFKYAAWYFFPTAYGPGWELIAAAAARIAGSSVVANVLVFKMVGVLAYAATTWLIALTLRRQAPDRALYGVVLFAWNPLVLYTTAGTGHNDAVMVLFVVLGLYLAARERFTLAALAQVAGALIKFIPALLVPVVMVAGLKRLRTLRERLIFLAVTSAACAAFVVALYWPFWRGGDILGITRRSDLLTTSLPTLLLVTLQPALGASLSLFVVTRLAAILILAWIVRELRKQWRRVEPISAADSAASILLFYLLATCLWFQAWYPVWPVALAALLPDGALVQGAILLAYLATWKMPLFEFVLVPGPVLPPRTPREWGITLGTLGLAWAFWGWQFANKLKKGLVRSRVSPEPPS